MNKISFWSWPTKEIGHKKQISFIRRSLLEIPIKNEKTIELIILFFPLKTVMAAKGSFLLKIRKYYYSNLI